LLFESIANVVPMNAQEQHHTKIRLVADVKSIQPATTFSVGLLMTMDPGWHTYWKNAGEAGLPPEIQWTLPNGITAGDIQWPVPHKYVEGGEVVVYGYEKENMLLVPMTASADLKSGVTVTLTAFASWLECEQVCIPADAVAELKLSVSDTRPERDNAELFGRYMRLVPQPLGRAGSITLAVTLNNGVVELQVAPTPGNKLVVEDGVPDFYPESYEDLKVGRVEVHGTDAGAMLRIPLSLFVKGGAPDMFRGVLVYQLLAEGRRANAVEIPLPEDFASALHVVGEGAGTGLLDQTFETSQSPDSTPLLTYVLFAVLGGLLLNIMPCVLPVIGLKIFGLVKLGGENPAKIRRLGAFFSLGIVATFLALALFVIVLKATGEQIGWGFQFQEPLFVIAMSTVVFAFGLSLFGVYEIRLPGLAVSGVGNVVERAGKGSMTGSFAEGVFATILATPCTAPILGTALGFAFAQPPAVVILIFTCVAIGMALPYAVLTLKPEWMRRLPKPGEWMVTAKQFMGFLMMATLVWLLYVLGKQLGMEAVIWTSSFLVVVGFVCWLIGRFATLTASRGKTAATWAFALLVLMVGYWLFLQPLIEADEMISGDTASTTSEISREVSGIPWEKFSLSTLEGYLKEGRPVFIDFTADWCLTCKVNEKAVLGDEDVVAKFRSSGIIAIKADWTRRDADITRLLSKFGRSGVPLYVVFPQGRPTAPIVLPEVITASAVLDAIEKATNPPRKL
jgi:thiol:disulfide interchange protein DsbD